MPVTILPITVGQMIVICIVALVILFVLTKSKGIKGTWTDKSEISPFVNHYLSSDIPEEEKIQKESALVGNF